LHAHVYTASEEQEDERTGVAMVVYSKGDVYPEEEVYPGELYSPSTPIDRR